MELLGGHHPLEYLAVSFLLLPCVVESLLSSYPYNYNYKPQLSYASCTRADDESSTRDHNGDDGEVVNRLVIFGLGNIGSSVATTTTSQSCILGRDSTPFFEHVCGTTRSSLKNIPGVQAIRFEDYQELAENLRKCTHVLVTIPPVKKPADFDCKFGDVAIGGRRRRLKYCCDPILNHPKVSINELVPSKAWIGYISSTSVYGNHDGEWVTEESEVRCESGTKGELYFKAENEWRDAAREFGWRLHVFRASGLYGNTRSALHTLRNGNFDESAYRSGSEDISFTSRIHEEDATRAIIAAMKCNQPLAGDSCLWNLADNYPASRSEVMMFGKSLLEEANLLPRESLESKAILTQSRSIQSERARRRSIDKKRVQNQKMTSLLQADGLMYPTYQEGLLSILGMNRQEWSNRL